MNEVAPFSTWHGPFGQTSIANEDLRQELRATLLAMRELGPEFDQAATDAFIDRITPTLAARLGSRGGRDASAPHRPRLRAAAITVAAFMGAMLLAGPFMHDSHGIGRRYGWYGNGRPVFERHQGLPAVPNPPQAPAPPAAPAVPAPPPLPTF